MLWHVRQQERHEASRSILPAARLPSTLMPKAPNKPALTGTSGTNWTSVPPRRAALAAGVPHHAGIAALRLLFHSTYGRWHVSAPLAEELLCVVQIPVDF